MQTNPYVKVKKITKKQLDGIIKSIHIMKVKLSKKNICFVNTEILQMRNSVSLIKSSVESLTNRVHRVEDKIQLFKKKVKK